MEVILYNNCSTRHLLKFDIIVQLCFPRIRPYGVLFDGGLLAKMISQVGDYSRGLIRGRTLKVASCQKSIVAPLPWKRLKKEFFVTIFEISTSKYTTYEKFNTILQGMKKLIFGPVDPLKVASCLRRKNFRYINFMYLKQSKNAMYASRLLFSSLICASFFPDSPTS